MALLEIQETALAQAEEVLAHTRESHDSEKPPLTLYREFLKSQHSAIRQAHRDRTSGIEVAVMRSATMDVLLNQIFSEAKKNSKACKRTGMEHPVTLIASGGYGRGQLNPGSDIDLQFLIPGRSQTPPKPVEEMVKEISTLLFDLGFEVSYPVRSIKGATKFANNDHHTKTTLLDARFIAGDGSFFDEFEETFFNDCIRGKEKAYLAERTLDIRSRHKKYGNTIHLQEPNVKEGCGGLRDYHNLIWVMWVLRKSRDLEELVSEGRLTEMANREIEEAFEFLMRVRNGLHYSQKGSSGDILTLRLQGVVATAFDYPQETIIRRSESFMRDYYRHTRNLFHHSTSLMQSFELEVKGDDSGPIPILNFLATRNKPRVEKFDGFVSKDGLIFPEHDRIFKEEPRRLMRFFLHCQQRHLRTSPEIRRLFKKHWDQIDGHFRRSKSNRETFEAILNNRGEVAHILRSMHRLGFLGRYLPEFGKLTDLVQHEFFHRYSADEHTLRCIDVLDSLVHTDNPKEQFFRRIFQDLPDPVAMYIALLLHDTGRAEDVRQHEDASAILASNVCKRLNYTGDRLRLIMFLVDHHLTFWRTATTRNIEAPETIANFASAVRNPHWMEALHLFSYVDSKGTNEEAWNDWKAFLMKQLHQSTLAYFQDRESFDRKFNRPVAETKSKVLKQLPESYEEEVEAHFSNMPERYFVHRGSSSITRHVKLIHRFLKIVGADTPDSLIPIIGWEARKDEGYSLIEVVGWNRHHHLAKVAGALAARNLNILSADFFTRRDDLILDIFRVCTPRFTPATEREAQRVQKMLEAEFGAGEDDVDFEKLIAEQAKPSILAPEPADFSIPQRVFISNELSKNATVMEIQAADRIGLLYDIFTALGHLNAEVLNARISTQAGAAIDRLYLVGTHTGAKITDRATLYALEEAVNNCLKKKNQLE